MTPGTSISYTTLSDYKSHDQVCDYCLQISPLDGYNGSNMTVNEKYIFAGDYNTLMVLAHLLTGVDLKLSWISSIMKTS